jgi:hypothetical protein
MAIRVPINHTSRAGSGAVPVSASMMVYLRGTTTQASVFAAATGGSALAQPITPDASGNYTQWVSEPGQYDYVETINSVVMPTLSRDLVAGALEAWTNFSLSNSWVTFGAPYATPGYLKTSDDLVLLRGIIKNGTMGAVAATLPAGYRPGATLVLTRISNSGLGRVDINNVGSIVPTTPSSNVYVSLEGITFQAEL